MSPINTEILEDKALSVNDMVDLLGSDASDDDNKEKVITDTEAANKEKEGEKKEPELEEEIIPQIEEDELKFEHIPGRQEILKSFPEIFKKFPGLESQIYKGQQLMEVFPTMADANDAKEKAENYDKFEESLLKGSIEEVLLSIKESDQKAFGKITSSILPTLYKVDKETYYNSVKDLGKTTAVSMWNEGVKNNNDNLKAAASILHQYLFGTAQITGPEARVAQEEKPNEEEERLKSEREQFVQERFELAQDNLDTRFTNIIKSNLDKYLDPKSIMTDYVRRTATNQIIEEVKEAMSSDDRFEAIRDKLWERAFDSNFNESSMQKLRDALLSKARTILPQIIQRVKTEALKGAAAKTKEASESNDKRPVTVGRTATSSSSSKIPELKKGMKSIDYLMSDE